MNKWHDQITSLTLRLYAQDKCYDDKDEYSCVIQAEIFSDNSAYLHAALKSNGLEISYKEWALLFQILHIKYGIVKVRFERKNSEVEIDISRILARKNNYIDIASK